MRVLSTDAYRPLLIAAVVVWAVTGLAAENWSPRKRPDRAFGDAWQFLGCNQSAIDMSCWAGEIPGYVCQWRRSSEGTVGIVREERYTMAGDFYLGYERTEDEAEEYSLVFFDHGRAYFRLAESARNDGTYVAEVVLKGRTSARYSSGWDRVITGQNGELVSVPMDIQLVSGVAFPLIDTFQAQLDGKMLRRLKRDGVNLSELHTVEFGFWFDDAHRPTALADLMDLGCRWQSAEDRNGTIGPYPGHCAMSVSLNATTLAEWHSRFTELARRNAGRYYGWTTVNMRSNNRVSPSEQAVTAPAKTAIAAPARPAGYAHR